jgi:hypothetical protein
VPPASFITTRLCARFESSPNRRRRECASPAERTFPLSDDPDGEEGHSWIRRANLAAATADNRQRNPRRRLTHNAISASLTEKRLQGSALRKFSIMAELPAKNQPMSQ